MRSTIAQVVFEIWEVYCSVSLLPIGELHQRVISSNNSLDEIQELQDRNLASVSKENSSIGKITTSSWSSLFFNLKTLAFVIPIVVLCFFIIVILPKYKWYNSIVCPIKWNSPYSPTIDFFLVWIWLSGWFRRDCLSVSMEWTPQLESLQNLANILSLSNRMSNEYVHNNFIHSHPARRILYIL